MAALTYLPCSIEHVELIEPQSGTFMDKAYFIDPAFHHIIQNHFSISAWAGMECIAAAGVVSIYKDRGVAWAFLGAKAGPYMPRLTAKVRSVLNAQPMKRIEMLVDYDFEAGHRWAKVLGFKVEAERMRFSGYYGNDETMYVRIKP